MAAIMHTSLTCAACGTQFPIDRLQPFEPTDAVVEKLFFSKNVRTALSVGQARGVALLAAAQANLTIHEYTPLQIKQAVAGHGKAAKEQVARLAADLIEWSQRNRARLTTMIRDEVRDQLRQMGVASQDEVDALRKRVRDLERASRARTAKASSAKRASSKSSTAKSGTAKPATKRASAPKA